MRNNFIYLGIAGKAHSGKNTVGEHIFNMYEFMLGSFAKNVKQASKIIFGLTDEQMQEENKEIVIPYWNLSPRKMYQIVGHELRTHVSDDLWIKSMELQISLSQREHLDGIVFTDLRYKNEADYVHENGGYIIYVERNMSEIAIPEASHISENSFDMSDADFIIKNDMTIPDLLIEAEVIVEEILLERHI